MREKFARFMMGRYGNDQLNRFLLVMTFVFLVISTFFRNNFLYFLALACLIYSYFRMFSKNIQKRYAENQKYLNMTAGLRAKFSGIKNQNAANKGYHIYTCPACGQKIRIPKGKGKIQVTCPKCRTSFVKRSW